MRVSLPGFELVQIYILRQMGPIHFLVTDRIWSVLEKESRICLLGIMCFPCWPGNVVSAHCKSKESNMCDLP
ncbi:hypothetical protein CR513_59215, partial [Mucuna pruriens]